MLRNASIRVFIGNKFFKKILKLFRDFFFFCLFVYLSSAANLSYAYKHLGVLGPLVWP
jgi:hypothetical protein